MDDSMVERVAQAMWDGTADGSHDNPQNAGEWLFSEQSLFVRQQYLNDARAAIAAMQPTLDAAREAGRREGQAFHPTHQHVKRGTSYQMIGTALLQAAIPPQAGDALAIYRGQGGDVWARPASEFRDGRYVLLPPKPESGT